MNTQSVKMLYKPQDENDNQVEIAITKNQHINRRFNWPRKRFLLEIGFYAMTLIAVIFLLTIVYMLTRQSIHSDRFRCPTVTILRPKDENDWIDKAGARRSYPDPSDPLYALCGPCPQVSCPKCLAAKSSTCPPCPSPDDYSCPTVTESSTCQPCSTINPDLTNETYPSTLTTSTSMETFAYTEEYRTENLCLSKNCVIQASDLLKSLDSKLVDCTRFHEFSCKGIISKGMKKDWTSSKENTNRKTEIDSNFNAILSEITAQSVKEKPLLREIRNFYQSCLNEDQIERKGNDPLKELIKSLGGWPVLESGDQCSTSFDLTETLIKIHDHGALNTMIFTLEHNVAVNKTIDDVNTLILFPSLGMGNTNLYLTKKWGNYYEIMIDTALKLGASKQSALRSMNQVLEFETKIAQIVAKEGNKESLAKKSIDLFQISSIFANIEWPRYLKSIGGSIMTGNERINVTSIEFLKQLNELISQTERRTICNYIVWRVILDCMPRLNRYWRQLYSTSMRMTELSHKENCDRQVITYFHNLLPLVYFKEHFYDLETIKFKTMIQHITNASIHTFKEVFVSNVTLTQSSQRIISMRDYILDIHRLVGSNLIDTMFSELKLKEDEYFENKLELTKFARKSVIESLKSNDPSILRYLSLGNPFLNEIRSFSNHLLIILATINTHQALTDLNFLNYSSIGLSIMHQLFSMLFESVSVNSDLIAGKISLQPIRIDKLSDKLSCKLAQFNLTEEISPQKRDFIKDYLVYTIVGKAFLSEENDGRENSFLPGLNYDPNQIFFINLAKTSCGKVLRSKSPKDVKLNEKPLQRMDFILHESEAFRKSFSCDSMDNQNCQPTSNQTKILQKS